MNNALPDNLQLKAEIPTGKEFAPDSAMLRVLFSAKKGAAVSYTGDASRYIWPQKNVRSTNNFWIRWQPIQGHAVGRRTQASWLRGEAEVRTFRESSLSQIFRYLVTDRRVKFRTVRKRHFELF